jgi:hypothetical protein
MDGQGSHLLSIRQTKHPQKTQEWKLLLKKLQNKEAFKIFYRPVTDFDSWL